MIIVEDNDRTQYTVLRTSRSKILVDGAPVLPMSVSDEPSVIFLARFISNPLVERTLEHHGVRPSR